MNVVRPETLSEALHLYHDNPDYLLLAGGSDISPAIRQGKTVPGLIEIGRLEALQGVEQEEQGVRIGALTTITELLNTPLIYKQFPLLQKTCHQFASKQIRNMATLGGNIGNASPAGDLLPVLLVLAAEIELISIEGIRTLPAADLFLGYKRLALEQGEMIRSVRLPFAEGWESYYRKVGRRNALNIAVASLAGLIRHNGNNIAAIRLAAGSVHTHPVRLRHVERTVCTTAGPDRQTLLEALKRDIAPHSGLRGSAAYRLEVTANMILECIDALE